MNILLHNRLFSAVHEKVEQAHADVLHNQISFDLLQFIDLRWALAVNHSPVDKSCQCKAVNGTVAHDAFQRIPRTLDLSDIEFHHCGRSQLPANQTIFFGKQSFHLLIPPVCLCDTKNITDFCT